MLRCYIFSCTVHEERNTNLNRLKTFTSYAGHKTGSHFVQIKFGGKMAHDYVYQIIITAIIKL